jgi:hypothetical protein
MYMDSVKRRVKQNNRSDSSRKTGEIAAGTVKNFIQPIKLFYEAHDLPPINWKRIFKALPKGRRASNDRAPAKDEICKAIQANDRRVKPIVLVMCSSGIRLGAWDYLRWKHVIPQKNDKGEIVAAKLIVYAEEHDEYYSFITPEAYNALLDYMDFRALHGEKITPQSWLMLAPLLTNQSAFATFPGENEKIAFTSQRDGNAEIYVMNADGSGQTNISNNPSADSGPSW